MQKTKLHKAREKGPTQQLESPELTKSAKPKSITPDALEFLEKEYQLVNANLIDIKNTLSSRFNFYLVIVSIVVGAVITVIQTSANNLVWPYTLFALLTLLIIISIVFQGGFVSNASDILRYRIVMLEIQRYLERHFRDDNLPIYNHAANSEVQKYLERQIQANIVVARRHPERKVYNYVPVYYKQSKISRFEKNFCWLFPQGMYHFFAAFITSVCFSALVILLSLVTGQLAVIPVKTVVVSSIVLIGTYIIQNVYGNIKKNRRLSSLSLLSQLN